MKATQVAIVLIALICMAGIVSAAGSVTIAAPHKAVQGEVKTVILLVDGVDNGTVKSDAPKTIKIAEGEHTITIVRDSGEVLQQNVTVKFGKTVSTDFKASNGDNPFQSNGNEAGYRNIKVGNIRVIVNAHNVGGTCVVAGTAIVTNEGTLNTETHMIGVQIGGYDDQQFMVTLKPGETKLIRVLDMMDEGGLHKTGKHRIVAGVTATVK